MIEKEKTPEFYRDFYHENRITLLQYKSLRKNFNKMVKDVLGEDYYNFENDVYSSDKECCNAITKKANMTALERLFK